MVESGCSEILPGDFAVPFQERPRPEFKQTSFEQFAVPTGKTKGRIVLAQDLGTLVGARRIVYLNVGEAQGVKPGDYFRALRDYASIADNPAEALPFKAPPYDPTQKNPPKFQFRAHAGELPIRAIGELMVLSTTPNTATALTTYVPEDIHLGDTIEMISSSGSCGNRSRSAADYQLFSKPLYDPGRRIGQHYLQWRGRGRAHTRV